MFQSNIYFLNNSLALTNDFFNGFLINVNLLNLTALSSFDTISGITFYGTFLLKENKFENAIDSKKTIFYLSFLY